MKFRIDYEHKENNNAVNQSWDYDFQVISAESEDDAREKFKSFGLQIAN